MIDLGYILGTTTFLATIGAVRFVALYRATARRLEQEDT